MYLLLAFIARTVSDDLREYLSLLSDFRNPVTLSLITALVILTILFLAMRNAVLPRQKKILFEKNLLESKNIRLMAIFAELDPDPVLRIDKNGEIIFTNPAAQNSGFDELIGKPISDIFSMLNIDAAEFIRDNKEAHFNFYFLDKYYSVLIKGISYLNIAQAYMHDITELKLKEEQLENSRKELKEFSRYLQDKIEEERKRISRELHDDIGQKLVLLKINLQKDMNELTSCYESEAFYRNARIIEDISKEVKTIAYSLRPSTLEEIGLYSSLVKLIETVKIQSSIKGNLDFINIEERMDLSLEVSIYRIVQEAISNIVKYSKATEFDIQLVRRGKSLRLVISDNGEGFDVEKTAQIKGMGIRNMQERTETHGGTFRIISSPVEGTLIMINFPTEDLEECQTKRSE